MCIYHNVVKPVSRSAGQCAVAFAAYRAGERIHDEKTEKTYDYTRKKGVLYTEIMTPKIAPDWANDRAKLWNAVESSEKRKDSQVAREIMVALPAELNLAQLIKLVRGYILQQFIKKGMIADFAIHAPSKQGDDRNYHAHILLTMRNITPEGFGYKDREWNAKYNIYQWRHSWELHTNQALQQAGLDCRVDGRSHANKELDQEPRLHLGVQATALERKGIQSDRGNENRAIESRNGIRAELHRKLDEINKQTALFEDETIKEDHQQKLPQSGNSEENEGIKTPKTVMNSTEITHAVLDLSHDGQQQATPPINEIQLSDNNTLNADKDNSLDTQKIQNDLSLNQPGNQQESIGHKEEPSLEERKKALEQKAEAFKERQEKLKLQVENVPDKKTRDRLWLEAKLENSEFIRTYKNELAGILAEEDHKKNANKIVALKHKAKKAEQDYKKYAAEWAICAVRDDDYKPKDQRSANKIDNMKKAEKKRWAKFDDKVKANGWSSDRVKRERQNIKEEMDLQLADYFGLERSHDWDMSR